MTNEEACEIIEEQAKAIKEAQMRAFFESAKDSSPQIAISAMIEVCTDAMALCLVSVDDKKIDSFYEMVNRETMRRRNRMREHALENESEAPIGPIFPVSKSVH